MSAASTRGRSERRREAGLCRRVGGTWPVDDHPQQPITLTRVSLGLLTDSGNGRGDVEQSAMSMPSRTSPAAAARATNAPTGRCSAPRQPARASIPISNRSGQSQAGFVDPQRQHPYSLMRRRRNIEGTNSFESKGQRGEMKTLTVSTFAASGLAALCLGLTATAAQAAPSGPINAADRQR